MNDNITIEEQIREQKRKIAVLKNLFIKAAFDADISGQRQHGMELHRAITKLLEVQVEAAANRAENFKLKMDSIIRKLG